MAKQVLKNIGCCALVFAAGRAMGGDVITGNAPSTPLTTPAMQDDIADSQMTVFVPSGAENGGKLTDPFKYDNVVFRPHLDYSIQYGNGLQSQPGSSQDTLVQQIGPGLRVDLGRHWSADFSPTLRFYSSDKLKDEFDYGVSLVGSTGIGDWTLGVSQSANSSSAPLSETGQQTDTDAYSTALTASYFFNDKLSTDLEVGQDLTYVTNPYTGPTTNGVSKTYGTRSWSTMDWLNYTFFPRLNAGIGAGGGYVDPDAGLGPGQTDEQFQGRIRWRATDKLSLNLGGGFEEIQYTSQGFSDVLEPTMNASIEYQPFQHTEISLTASRKVTSSFYYVISSDTENTSVNLDLNQRLLKKFTLDVNLSYTEEDFITAIGPFSLGNRTDNSYGISTRLSHPFFKRGTWGLTYQVTDNQSNQQGFTYTSTMFGFDVNYTY